MVTSDLNPHELTYWGHKYFGIEYLSEATRTPAFPIEGKIHGLQGRLLANLLVWSIKRNPINVVYVVDTGAGDVQLSFEALRALFPSLSADELDARFMLYVHSDRQIECIQSPAQIDRQCEQRTDSMIARQTGNWLVDGPAMHYGSGLLPFIIDKFEKMPILFVPKL